MAESGKGRRNGVMWHGEEMFSTKEQVPKQWRLFNLPFTLIIKHSGID